MGGWELNYGTYTGTQKKRLLRRRYIILPISAGYNVADAKKAINWKSVDDGYERRIRQAITDYFRRKRPHTARKPQTSVDGDK